MIHSIEGCHESHPLHTAHTFASLTLKQGANTKRRWSAYLHHVGHLQEDVGVTSIFQQLNWRKIIELPEACVVEVFSEPLRGFSRESNIPTSFVLRS
jgi:predicted HD phosphohydrolase